MPSEGVPGTMGTGRKREGGEKGERGKEEGRLMFPLLLLPSPSLPPFLDSHIRGSKGKGEGGKRWRIIKTRPAFEKSPGRLLPKAALQRLRRLEKPRPKTDFSGKSGMIWPGFGESFFGRGSADLAVGKSHNILVFPMDFIGQMGVSRRVFLPFFLPLLPSPAPAYQLPAWCLSTSGWPPM